MRLLVGNGTKKGKAWQVYPSSDAEEEKVLFPVFLRHAEKATNYIVQFTKKLTGHFEESDDVVDEDEDDGEDEDEGDENEVEKSETFGYTSIEEANAAAAAAAVATKGNAEDFEDFGGDGEHE